MIRLDDNTVITVDEYSYTLAKDIHIKDKKGNDLFKSLGHYTSLRAALKAFAERDARVRLQDGSYSLADAINIISEADERLDALIAKHIPTIH